VVSNPPFNDSGWGEDRVNPEDPRFRYGVPPDNNGNFAWIQHYIYHLAPRGKAGFVMANGALSGENREGEIMLRNYISRFRESKIPSLKSIYRRLLKNLGCLKRENQKRKLMR
jgi:hypothetical protein